MAILVDSGRLTGFSSTQVVTVPEYDPARTFFFVQGRTTVGSNPNHWLIRINSNLGGSTDEISLQSLGGSGFAVAQWWMVRCTNEEFRVQKVQATISVADGLGPDIQTINAVDLSRTMLISSARLQGSSSLFRSEGAPGYVHAQLISSTQIRHERYDVFEAGAAFATYVVEWDPKTGVTVDSGQITGPFASTVQVEPVGGAAIDLALHALSTSSGHDTNTLEGTSPQFTLAGPPTNGIAYTRFNTTSATESPTSWFVTRFPAGRGVAVQQAIASFVAANESIVVPLSSPVNASGSTIYVSNSCDGDGTTWGRSVWTPGFTSVDAQGMSSEVTLDRMTGGGQPGFVTLTVIDYSQSTLVLTGDIGASAPFADATIEGEQTQSNGGDIVAVAPFVDATVTGGQRTTGVITTTAPFVEASIVGGQSVQAALSATAPFVVGRVRGGQTTTGAIATTAPFADATLAGAQGSSGAIAATAPFSDATLAGGQGSDGVIATTAPFVDATLAGGQGSGGAILAVAPFADATLTAGQRVSGDLIAAAPFVNAGVEGEQSVQATVDATAPFVDATIAAGQRTQVSLSTSAPFADVAVQGEQRVSGTVATVAPFADALFEGRIDLGSVPGECVELAASRRTAVTLAASRQTSVTLAASRRASVELSASSATVVTLQASARRTVTLSANREVCT